MGGVKSKDFVVCKFCKKEIFGNSKKHARKNLKIHQLYSKQCNYIKELLIKEYEKSEEDGR